MPHTQTTGIENAITEPVTSIKQRQLSHNVAGLGHLFCLVQMPYMGTQPKHQYLGKYYNRGVRRLQEELEFSYI